MPARVALVTGAGDGIGRAVAEALAKRGTAVAVTDIALRTAESTVERIRDAGGAAVALELDVTDEEATKRAVAETIGRFGRLDVAVNNAGVPSSGVQLETMSADDWDRVLRINLTGVFFSLKHEIPAMRAAGGGAIVNVASGGGLFAIPRSPAYVASKHGVVGLTKSAAVDYASDGIRVNAIAPGMTRTERLAEVAEGTAMVEAHLAATPLGRLAETSEIAEAAVWLCSDEAGYITGTVLNVDGGRRA